jgi:hypothetical protein
VNAIRKIANSDYHAISVGQQDDWIMRPSMGKQPPWTAGILPDGTAWFFNGPAGFVFYDAARRQLAGRLRTPPATGFDGKDSDSYLNYAVLQNEDGRLVYLLLFHGSPQSTDLHVVDLERREIVRSARGMPSSGLALCKPVLARDGRILVSAILRDDGIAAALLRIDPQTGDHEVSTCEGSRAKTLFVNSSPCGRYWLRADDSRIPMVEEEAALLTKLFGIGAQPKQYFSFAVEIWEAFPLRRLHSVAPMWMTPEQLPDNGHIDHEQRQKGLPAKRGELYRKVAKLLDQDSTLAASRINKDSHPDLWPDPDGFYTNIDSNLRDFALSGRDVIGWQPDSRAFWLRRQDFVSCVGMDGTVSPKIMLQRFGMETGRWLPCARAWHDATPLPDRRLDMRFVEGTVTVDGTPGDPAQRLRIVTQSEDHFRATPPPHQKNDEDAALAKKAEAIAKKYSTYSVDLASMDEADCIAAIDALAGQIGPDINERVFDNRVQAVFRLDGKRLNEKKFFTHVAKHCPGAAPALTRLIEAACEHVRPHTLAWYDPYGDDELPTGLFGYAAWCLARTDKSSNEVLLRYRRLIDTDHEHFYFEKTVPLMLDNAGNAGDRLRLAEGFYFSDLGNAIDHAAFWRMAKMAESASNMTPQQYAARLQALASETAAARSDSELGYYCFDNLERFLTDPSDWEKALLGEIRAGVLQP